MFLGSAIELEQYGMVRIPRLIALELGYFPYEKIKDKIAEDYLAFREMIQYQINDAMAILQTPQMEEAWHNLDFCARVTKDPEQIVKIEQMRAQYLQGCLIFEDIASREHDLTSAVLSPRVV